MFTVIRLTIEEILSQPVDEPISWDVLVWPDGLYTNLEGWVMDRDGSGGLKRMARPFRGKRSLEGVNVLKHGQPGTGCVWAGFSYNDVAWPEFPSPDGEDHEYYRRLDCPPHIDQMPTRTSTLPILDEHGQEWKSKYEEGYWLVEWKGEWRYIDHK